MGEQHHAEPDRHQPCHEEQRAGARGLSAPKTCEGLNDPGRDRPITPGGPGAKEREVLAGGHDARAALVVRCPHGGRRSGSAAPA
jgi:hypothetical protein